LSRVARCIMARPTEEHFYHPRMRGKIEHPAGQISAQSYLFTARRKRGLARQSIVRVVEMFLPSLFLQPSL
jgi:hypothetical protein